MRRIPLSGGLACLLCLCLLSVPMTLAKDDAKPEKPQAKKPAVAEPAKKAEEKADAAKKEAKKDKEKEPKKTNVVQFTLKDEFPEGPTHEGLFSERKTSLATLIERLDQAAEDKDVAAVWLRIDNPALGRGKIHEIRQAIARVRKAGKPVYAELTSADTREYLLAAACDEIIMPPSGMLVLPGVRAEVTFYKGLLDKLGLEFDALQMGRYKGAAEPLTRTSMSPPLRESLEAIVNDTYDNLADIIAGDRKMKDHKVKTLLDDALFAAAAAQRAGLIDHVLYADQFQELIQKNLKAEKLNIVTKYKKKDVDTDFSGLTGFMKLMELLMGGKKTEAAGKDKKIAVVYAVGPIMEGDSSSDVFGDGTVGSRSLVAALKKAADDPKVLAIVLRIDSPGGSAVASDLIWRQTVTAKKPVIASMGDVAASGGYYIAMGASQIFAEPGTLTGSIGVIGGKMVVRGLFDKIGLTTEVISRGQMSGSLSATQPFSPEERKAWTAMLRETYNQFVNKAAQGRKMDPRKLEQLAQGRVYTGRMAKANGLVDELGTLKDAIAAAKKAAGLAPTEKVDIEVLPKPKTIFEQLFGDQSLSSELESAMPEVVKPLIQAKTLRRLFSERTLLWMPYEVRVK